MQFWRHIFRRDSLQRRLAFFFIAAMLCILLIAFSLIYFCEYSYITGIVRKRLANLLHEFTYEYLTAQEEPADGFPLPLEALPPGKLALLRSTLNGFEPAVIYRSSKNEVLHVAGHSREGIFEVLLSTKSRTILAVEDLTDAPHLEHIREEFTEESYGYGIDDTLLALIAADGTVLAHSGFSENLVEPLCRLNHSEALRGGFLRNVKLGRYSFMVLRQRQFDGSSILVAGNLRAWQDNRNTLRLIFLLTLLGLTPIGLAIALFASRKFTAGLVRVAAAAAEIEKGNYDHRVAKQNEGKEIDDFIDVFNSMVETTKKTLTNLRNVTDDVAHDLRTPITRMRAQAEMALYGNGAQTLPGMVAEECDKMLSLINTMLDITRTEMGISAEALRSLELNTLLQRLVDFYSTLAEDRQMTMQCDLPDSKISIRCQPRRLEQMVANLIDNAVKYTPDGGAIHITLQQQGGNAHIIIADTGCGIPAEALPHIFERFYRADSSRSKSGNGLGLSMVAAVAAAHNGRVDVQSAPGQGSTFTVILPLLPSGAQA